MPFLFLVSFLLGLMDFSVSSFMVRNVLGGAGGWYLYTIVIPISILIIFGFFGLNSRLQYGNWFAFLLIICLALTNIWGVFFRLMPFYSGYPEAPMSRTARSGILLSSPLHNFSIMVSHLSQNKPAYLTQHFITGVTLVFLLAVALAVLLPSDLVIQTRPLLKSHRE